MTRSELIGCAIVGVLTLLVVAMAIVLLTGKGAWMIAGFNMLDKKEQERYDVPRLCKFMGKYLLSIALVIPAIPIAGIFRLGWLTALVISYLVLSALFVGVYCNTGSRFRK